MNNDTTRGFISQNIHLFLLGTGAFISSFALVLIKKIGASAISGFGPTAQIYFDGIEKGLTISATILFISFIGSLFFYKQINKVWGNIENFYNSGSNLKKNLIILFVCLSFTFLSHPGNIINGYFNMDDFMVAGLNNSLPFNEAVLKPHGNDHTIPLFRIEMKGLDTIFGQTPTPYNGLIFILFSLIPFFTYLYLRNLKIPLSIFFIFLIIFVSATGWSDMLTGFYIMSIYPQIILFFSIALWSYTEWLISKKNLYMAIFGISIALGLLCDTSAIWIIPAIFLFIFSVNKMNLETKI